MGKKEVLDLVLAYKQLLEGVLPLKAVFLYGSYSRGSAHENSDIDVALVVDGIDGDYLAIRKELWKLRRSIDYRIEPVLIDMNDDPSGFLEIVEREGIRV